MHKYTLKLYKYAVLEDYLSVENEELMMRRYIKLKSKISEMASQFLQLCVP